MDYSVHVRVENLAESIYDHQFTFIFGVVETHLFPYDDNRLSPERVKTTEFVQPLDTLVPPWSNLRVNVSNMLSRLEPSEQDPPILLVPLTQETRLFLSMEDDSDQILPYDALVSKICEVAKAVEWDPPCLSALVTIEKRVVMRRRPQALIMQPFFEQETAAAMLRSFEDAQVVRAAPAMRSAVEALETRQVSDEEFCCMVCLDNVSVGTSVEVTVMPCSLSHMFHGHCILEWLRQNHTCPLCRFKLPQE